MIVISSTLSLLTSHILLNTTLSLSEIHSKPLVVYSSSTMNYDPWENYNDNVMQNINNEIFKQEIERWDP